MKKFSRWHRFDINGVKYIKNMPIEETPTNEDGYSDWKRGTGPLPEDVYIKVSDSVRKACLGVPKSSETKLRMREAKLGVPKSDSHKQNMAVSQKLRHERIKNAKTQNKQESLHN